MVRKKLVQKCERLRSPWNYLEFLQNKRTKRICWTLVILELKTLINIWNESTSMLLHFLPSQTKSFLHDGVMRFFESKAQQTFFFARQPDCLKIRSTNRIANSCRLCWHWKVNLVGLRPIVAILSKTRRCLSQLNKGNPRTAQKILQSRKLVLHWLSLMHGLGQRASVSRITRF